MVLDSQDMIFVIFYLISLIERIFRITMGDGFQIKNIRKYGYGAHYIYEPL